MPYSKHDQSLQTHVEVANFTNHGDARGPSWLKAHTEDSDRARARLEKWAGADVADTAPADTAPTDVDPGGIATAETTVAGTSVLGTGSELAPG